MLSQMSNLLLFSMLTRTNGNSKETTIRMPYVWGKTDFYRVKKEKEIRHILETEISLLSIKTKFLFEEKGKLSR